MFKYHFSDLGTQSGFRICSPKHCSTVTTYSLSFCVFPLYMVTLSNLSFRKPYNDKKCQNALLETWSRLRYSQNSINYCLFSLESGSYLPHSKYPATAFVL